MLTVLLAVLPRLSVIVPVKVMVPASGRKPVVREDEEPENPPPLEIGAVAPDFELPGATRYGVLRDPVRLSDFSGKTVVLAFFFKARTRG